MSRHQAKKESRSPVESVISNPAAYTLPLPGKLTGAASILTVAGDGALESPLKVNCTVALDACEAIRDIATALDARHSLKDLGNILELIKYLADLP